MSCLIVKNSVGTMSSQANTNVGRKCTSDGSDTFNSHLPQVVGSTPMMDISNIQIRPSKCKFNLTTEVNGFNVHVYCSVCGVKKLMCIVLTVWKEGHRNMGSYGSYGSSGNSETSETSGTSSSHLFYSKVALYAPTTTTFIKTRLGAPIVHGFEVNPQISMGSNSSNNDIFDIGIDLKPILSRINK